MLIRSYFAPSYSSPFMPKKKPAVMASAIVLLALGLVRVGTPTTSNSINDIQSFPSWLVASAKAQSVDDAKLAGVEYNAGRQAYSEDNYVAAAEHFERADAASPTAHALYLAMQSRQAAEQLDRAALLAALFISRQPEADEKKLADAQAILAEAKEKLGQIELSCDQDCNVLIGPRLVHGRASKSWVLFVKGGKQNLSITFSNDRQVKETVNVAEADSVTVAVKAPAMPIAAPIATDTDIVEDETPVEEVVESSGMSPVVFWSGVGVTSLGLGLSIWSGIDTINNPGEEAIQAGCTDPVTDCDLYQQGKSNETRTNILWVGTGVAAIATTLIGVLWTDWSGKDSSSSDSAKIKVRPYISVSNGALLGAYGSF